MKAKQVKKRRDLSLDDSNQKKISKMQMKRELEKQLYAEKQEKDIVKNKEKHVYKICVEKYEFKGSPREVFTAFLKKNSSTQKGYSTLNSGQHVTVEYFDKEQPLRITSIDGRKGITSFDNIVRLSDFICKICGNIKPIVHAQ